jgi:hypothetical protein
MYSYLAEFLGLEYETDNNWQSYYEFYEFMRVGSLEPFGINTL